MLFDPNIERELKLAFCPFTTMAEFNEAVLETHDIRLKRRWGISFALAKNRSLMLLDYFKWLLYLSIILISVSYVSWYYGLTIVIIGRLSEYYIDVSWISLIRKITLIFYGCFAGYLFYKTHINFGWLFLIAFFILVTIEVIDYRTMRWLKSVFLSDKKLLEQYWSDKVWLVEKKPIITINGQKFYSSEEIRYLRQRSVDRHLYRSWKYSFFQWVAYAKEGDWNKVILLSIIIVYLTIGVWLFLIAAAFIFALLHNYL